MSSCETVVKSGPGPECKWPNCGCENPPKNSTSSGSATTSNCAECPGDCKPGECKR
ncbi:hypothetical protein M407DRAFT_241387 [Tulasnella calospora MUT 4182]|uniref:Metallothionein n=1 Tax=Tulasnella calospora MUT 4182 TaxID=1051891 RepID=A0A0C3QV66_9AGAM|nr:hypothetical protein M407DRAFT_241387 [Tulasnella calospora MUT 4182]